MRRPITSPTRMDGFPISEWYIPLLLFSLISLALVTGRYLALYAHFVVALLS
jgi:hypothetical protein